MYEKKFEYNRNRSLVSAALYLHGHLPSKKRILENNVSHAARGATRQARLTGPDDFMYGDVQNGASVRHATARNTTEKKSSKSKGPRVHWQAVETLKSTHLGQKDLVARGVVKSYIKYKLLPGLFRMTAQCLVQYTAKIVTRHRYSTQSVLFSQFLYMRQIENSTSAVW